MPVAKALSKLLASPAKIAHNLDWRKVSGAVLSLNIRMDRIELAVASHPSFEEDVQHLPPIDVKTVTKNNTKVLDEAIMADLQRVVKNYNVCGLVVSWPTQKEGWCGAPCGRVLHTLDQIAESNIITANRPACLWDNEHNVFEEDSWGRSEVYCETSDKHVHVASQEQYKDHNTVAADVWNDFVKSHWPDLFHEPNSYQQKQATATIPKTTTKVNPEWLDSYEDSSSYVSASL